MKIDIVKLREGVSDWLCTNFGIAGFHAATNLDAADVATVKAVVLKHLCLSAPCAAGTMIVSK